MLLATKRTTDGMRETMKKLSVLFCNLVGLFVLAAGIPTVNAQALVGAYELNGNFDDTFGGSALVPNGGTIGATGYTFGVNQGLRLTNGVDTSNYSIVLVYEHDNLAPFWRKLLDFQSLTEDFGLYAGGDRLRFWTLATLGGPDTVAANSNAQVVITRDNATQTVKGYLNGVLQWTASDPMGQAIPASNILTFFEDDNATGRREAQSGTVDCVAIYDGPLSDTDVALLATREACGSIIQVSVDIKPSSDPNSINLCSGGAVPVAILGSNTVSVEDVDTETLRFAELSVKVVGKKNPHELCSYEDVNGDSNDDLVCKYQMTDLAAMHGETTSAQVNGALLDGSPFTGTDSVNIVKDECN